MQFRPRRGSDHSNSRLAIAAAIVLLFAIFIGIAGVFLFQDDDPTGEDGLTLMDQAFSSWVISPAMVALPARLATVSIFVLYVSYKGGRSRQKFFNDRTCDGVNSTKFDLFRRLSLVEAVLFFCPNRLLTGMDTKFVQKSRDGRVFTSRR